METETFKSGFVAVMGRPNVGKSTLVNALVGQKIAAVTPRPQTTRKRQMGILTTDTAQVIFIDTPGVHQPRHKLGESMNKEALETLEESDVILFVADGSLEPNEEDHLLATALHKIRRTPVLLALNKLDLVNQDELQQARSTYQELLPTAECFPVSAKTQAGLEALHSRILELLRAGEPFFPEDQITDLYEREIAGDLIREAALIYLRDEVPHGIAVRIDQYLERGEAGAYIEATLYVEKESHKPIVIGQKGEMLKKIGSSARVEIEKVTNRKIYLDLRVKVRKNWRDDEQVLKGFGF
jgi:GTPase